MRKIRITGVPGGQAPEEIRQDWIGVEIPIDDNEEQPSVQETGGVIDRGEHPVPKRVYSVFALEAFAALKLHSKTAWDWWYQATPHLFAEGRHLLFDESACELVA